MRGVVLRLGFVDRCVIARFGVVVARLPGITGLRFALRLGDIVGCFRLGFFQIELRIGNVEVRILAGLVDVIVCCRCGCRILCAFFVQLDLPVALVIVSMQRLKMPLTECMFRFFAFRTCIILV